MAKKETKKGSYAERIRENQRKKAQEAASKNTGNPNEWSPTEEGTWRVRVLPPVDLTNNIFNKEGDQIGTKGEEDEFFYMTHSYHFFEGMGPSGKGLFLWTPREFTITKNGKEIVVKDPIDEQVAEMYEIARKTDDEDLKKLAGKIKRKRQYFANILLYQKNEDGEFSPVYKILRDSTNEGKLISQICKAMGLPFFRDVQEEWVVASSLEIDEDDDVYDLLSTDEEGHDFKIKRTKTGKENWDFDYTNSNVVKQGRALSADEIELLEERVDLRNYVQYCSYEEALEALEEFKKKYLEDNDEDEDEDEEEEARKKAKEIMNKNKKRPVVEDEDEDEDDDDEESKPSKSSKGKEEKRKPKKSSKKQVDDDDDDLDLSDLDEDDE